VTPVNVLAISRAFNRHLFADHFTFVGHDQPGIVLTRSLLILQMTLAVDIGENQLTFVVHTIANGPVAHTVVEEHIFLGCARILFGQSRFDDDATFGCSVKRFIS
jgi:hypothetical protein